MVKLKNVLNQYLHLKRTLIILLLITTLARCKQKGEMVVKITPSKPTLTDTVHIEFSERITGFLWLREYYGNNPFDYTLRILPLNNTHEFKYYAPRSDLYLVVLTFEDTLKHLILTGPRYRIVYHDENQNPFPFAYPQIAHLFYRDDYDSLYFYLNKSRPPWNFSYFDELMNTALKQNYLTPEEVKIELRNNLPMSDTADPLALYAGFKTAYFVLNDSKLAIDYQKLLEKLSKTTPLAELYYKMTTIYTLAFDPFGELREGREPLILYTRFNTDSIVQRLVLLDDLIRWYMTRAFTTVSNHPLFYEFVYFLEDINDLHLDDLTLMRYIALGWMGEQDSSLLRFILEKTKNILDNQIQFRKQYAYSYWNRLSDFYRLKNRALTDFLKTKAKYLLMVNSPDSAYYYMKRFVDLQGTVFELWQDDVALFGETALKSGHIIDAQKAYSALLFFYSDTSALDYLNEVRKHLKPDTEFNDYLDDLKHQIESIFPNAPEFVGKSIDGEPVKLSALRNKIVVLNFWATWCGPCRKEIPELNALTKEFKDNSSVVFLAITDEDKQVVERFLRSTPFDYTIIIDGKGIRKKYHVNAFPTHFIVSPDGKIVFKQVGYLPGTKDKLLKNINRLLSNRRS